jgi:hypothetical protein
MKYRLIILLLITSLTVNAQIIDNKILGNYVSKSNTELYENFVFDNNGKATISGFGQGDYFIKGDTLILFPDKSMFKFLIKNNTLTGVSEWVKNGEWIKNNDQVVNNRKDDSAAQNNAVLLNEYYVKTRMKDNQMDILFDEKQTGEYLKTIESLCDRNLIRACKEVFGMETVKQMGGMEKVLKSKTYSEIAENPKLLNIANKIIKVDSTEGYNLLFLYYAMTNQIDKSDEALEKAISLGNKEAILTKMNLELAQSDGMGEKSNEDKTIDKYTLDSIFVSTLRLFNQKDYADFEANLISKYGFKRIDEKVSDNFEVRDYEDEKFNRISKFIYKDTTKNKIIYTTKDVDEINFFKLGLANYKLTESKDESSGVKYEDYKLKVKRSTGNSEIYQIQILYPAPDQVDEPTTIIIFK